MADAASPAQGRDHNGPTAVCTSARCYDHSKFMDGLALNIRIHPSALNREDGLAKLRDMTKAYLDFGGMEDHHVRRGTGGCGGGIFLEEGIPLKALSLETYIGVFFGELLQQGGKDSAICTG